MKAMAAERAVLRASQPGPNIVNAKTPMAAQPICAINILYFLAPGEEGVAKRTAQTAPNGAIVIDIPFGANIWSIFPSIAIAANAPAEGQKTSLSAGALELFSGIKPSHIAAPPADALIMTEEESFFLLITLLFPNILLSFKPKKDLPTPRTDLLSPESFEEFNTENVWNEEKDVDGNKMQLLARR